MKMRVAFGLKAHSGWAALVVVGVGPDGVEVVDRRRIVLVHEHEADWAKQPYHAALGLRPPDARRLVGRAVRAADRHAAREIRAAVGRAREAGHEVVACAVLVGGPMPPWSVDEILAVHFRMHKAEGVLFREALARAAAACGLRQVSLPEKTLASTHRAHAGRVAALGKTVGPPWGKDQKEAALAALVALDGREAGAPVR
jgi:hypothetical protein